MRVWLWGLLSSGTASYIEFYARTHREGNPYRWWMIPLAVLINYGVVQMLRSATILEFAVIFGFIGGSLRILFTILSNDHVSVASWTAYSLVLLATLLKTFWR